MNKLNIIYFLFFLIFINQAAFASTEKVFSDSGYSDFIVEGKNQQQCFTYNFLGETDSGLYPVLSLNTEFFPVTAGTVQLDIYLNEIKKASLNATDFKCSGQCISRIWFNQDDLLEKNDLNVCISTSNSITKATILSSSIFGFYETPLFSKDTFVKSVETKTVNFGEMLKVTLKLKNIGSKKANVDVNYMRNLVESEPKSYDIIGDSYFSGVIEAGEEKTFEYVIKPLRVGTITIIPSSVEFTDIFGEKQVLLSNVVEIVVEELTDKVISEIILDKSKAKIGETVNAKIALKNISSSKISDIYLKVLNNNQEIGSFNFDALNPYQTVYEDISITSDKASKSDITCTYIYEGKKASCKVISVAFDKEELSWAWIQSFVLILIGLVVFGGLYLYITESGKPKEPKIKTG
ncbi:MAG: BatD family protein [archaeon]